MTGFVLNMTGFVLNMTEFVINMTGFVLNMTGFFIFFLILKENLLSGGASQWRVCYQRGLPRLVNKRTFNKVTENYLKLLVKTTWQSLKYRKTFQII